MRDLLRPLLLLPLLLGLLLAPPARGEEPEVDTRKCICAPGTGACQHKLRNPRKPTYDPCWCHRCRETSKHDGKKVPFGWNPGCFSSKKDSLYLRRHAAAWGITCSECLEEDKACKFNEATCPDCQSKGLKGPLSRDYMDRPARNTVRKCLGRERRLFKDSAELRVLYNEHFYLVTDIKSVKVKISKATKRVVKGHEWAHLMMERAEYARREFTQTFGDHLEIDKPTGMYFPATSRDAQRIQEHYFGNPVANILYGGSDRSSVADAFCFHGFCTSMEDFGQGGDDSLHVAMRHMIGHELMSCWVVVNGENKTLPRWVHVAAAHWLSRLQPRFDEDAVACNLEGAPLYLTGEEWAKQLRAIAKKSKPGAIEKLFAKNAQGQLTKEDHQRAWSYFDLCLREWREPFVNMLAALRKKTPVRQAFTEQLGVTPEVFDDRWRARVLGKRKSMDPRVRDKVVTENESPGARARREMRAEKDPQTLAARVRSLGEVKDPKTAEMLVDLLARNSELVRETILVSLLKIADPKVREVVWKKGLSHADAMSRAYVARACTRQGLRDALPALRKQLADRNWYARAEAAIACGSMQDAEALTTLFKMTSDPAPKTRVAVLDALHDYGEAAAPAVKGITPMLSASAWQLRVASAQSLGGIGSMEAVEELITRMEIESGRLRKEHWNALKLITRDDLGRKPENWRKWWDALKRSSPNGLPDRPEPTRQEEDPAEVVDPNERYAQQEYFGIELFTNKVGFVLDTSGSMKLSFQPDPSQAKVLGHRLRGHNKISICKAEIAYSLQHLDPRSHFNVVSFGTRVKAWKKNPVPATKRNVEAGISWTTLQPADGETNYCDALRTVLDLGDRPDSSPGFRDTPDTITFLTDGMPTRGEITDPGALLEWFTALNRYSRVTTHVIAFGNRGVDINFLRGLATRNYGKFVHVNAKE